MKPVIKKAKPLKVSKNVLPGHLVSIRAGKLIRCGRRAKPVGVYQQSTLQKIHLLDGQIATVNVPSGIVFYGHANVKVSI